MSLTFTIIESLYMIYHFICTALPSSLSTYYTIIDINRDLVAPELSHSSVLCKLKIRAKSMLRSALD